MADADAQRDWVKRVLGVQVGPGDAGAIADTIEQAPPGASPRAVWTVAKDQVDTKLNQLAGSLRSFNHPDLTRIADFGIFGLTTGQGVALNKALLEFEAAAPDRRTAAAGKLRTAVAGFRQVIDTSPVVTQIDVNPFGIRPQMRATLGGALDRIEQGLA